MIKLHFTLALETLIEQKKSQAKHPEEEPEWAQLVARRRQRLASEYWFMNRSHLEVSKLVVIGLQILYDTVKNLTYVYCIA